MSGVMVGATDEGAGRPVHFWMIWAYHWMTASTSCSFTRCVMKVESMSFNPSTRSFSIDGSIRQTREMTVLMGIMSRRDVSTVTLKAFAMYFLQYVSKQLFMPSSLNTIIRRSMTTSHENAVLLL